MKARNCLRSFLLLWGLLLVAALKSPDKNNANPPKSPFRLEKRTIKAVTAGVTAAAVTAGVIHRMRTLSDPAVLAKKPLRELLRSGVVSFDAETGASTSRSFSDLENKTLLLFFDADVHPSLLSAESKKNRLGMIKMVHKINELLKESGADIPEFEVVFVPSTKGYDADSAKELKQLSWEATLGLNPSGYTKRVAQALRKKYNVRDNQLQIVSLGSGDQEVVCGDALSLLMTAPHRLPWHEEHVHALLGEMELKDRHNQSVNFADVVASGKNIGLYFSAGWHDHSAEHMEKLAALYEEVNHRHAQGVGKGLEIIYVGADSSKEEYEKQQQQMPWFVVAPEDAHHRDLLRAGLGVSSIPTLLVMDSKGNLLNENVMVGVIVNSTLDDFPWAETRVHDLNEDAGGSNMTVVAQQALAINKMAKGRTMMLFLEGASITKQRELMGVMEELAKKYNPPGRPLMLFGNSKEKRNQAVHFVSSRHLSRISQAFRNFCGLKPTTIEPALAVLELEKKRFYAKPLGPAVTASALKAQAEQMLENLDSLNYRYVQTSAPSNGGKNRSSMQPQPRPSTTAAPPTPPPAA